MSEIVQIGPRDFPPLLSEIPDPPKTLFVRGTVPPPHLIPLAIVGSRRMSAYAKDACAHLVRGLAGLPISIVSGLALGVDTIAHQTALAVGLHTLAIPGSGIDDASLYPRLNRALARDILAAGGGLMSEEAPGTTSAPWLFPKRNRLMAGMSRATLVVEAGERSGTLITARLTVDYGRELLIVPHSIFSEGGAGGHLFMKIGGAPVRSAADICEALGIEVTAPHRAPTLAPEEKTVLDVLSAPLPRDELIRALGMQTAEANTLLLSMELKGLIVETRGEIRKNI